MSRRSDPSAAAQSVRLPSQPIVVRVTASENDHGALRRAALLARATSRPVVAVYMRDLEYPVLSVSIDGMVTGLEWSSQAVEEDQLVAVARCIAEFDPLNVSWQFLTRHGSAWQLRRLARELNGEVVPMTETSVAVRSVLARLVRRYWTPAPSFTQP
jgi:hypothetical protein